MLEVNAEASGGQLRVELCDVRSEVLEGFSKGACAPITGDSLRESVRWSGKTIADVRGPVKLRLCLERAKVYSFTFRE